MVLFVLAYLAGILTIVSPCILPVLPFVFARADRPFLRSGLPVLAGMAVTFAVVATLAAVGGGWAVTANQYGRGIALVLLALFGLTLLMPALADRITRPLVSLGARLSRSADEAAGGGEAIAPSLLLGVATGLLWAPCAGPILGLILTGAALSGANVGTTVLLVAYAAGAATSLALALVVGGRLFKAMKNALGAGEIVRKVLGFAVLAGVAAIALGLDTGILTQLSTASTSTLEQRLIANLQPSNAMMQGTPAADSRTEGAAPEIAGAVTWLNSPPLTMASLKGKVVVIDFWTYSCINCLRSIPYVRAWAEKYKDRGLVVIGVHAPEFAFEKNIDNVRKAVADLGISYPVAVDNNYRIWRAFKNQYWPAHYFIDAKGQVRHHHFGEGEYEQSEHIIQSLLREAGQTDLPSNTVDVAAAGTLAPPSDGDVKSPETYIGYGRAAHFISAGGVVKDTAHHYTLATPRLDEWGLSGDWTISRESALSNTANDSIVFRFHARDLHLVLGTSNGAPVSFTVTIDGKPPGEDHGEDVDADGGGSVTGERLYQLIRARGPVVDHTFEIKFSSPGVRAYSFTFG